MRTLFFVLILLSGFAVVTHAQQAKLTEPPFLAHSSNFIMTLFNLNPDDVQPLLPPGISVKINDTGMVTGGFEMYETDRVQGISKYAMAFIFVEVADLESNNGTPGHWAIWGRVGQESALQSMIQHFNFPYHLEDVRITKQDNVYTGSVGAGLLTIKIKFNDQTPFSGEGIVNMCSMSKGGKVLKTEVPWFSTGSVGEILQIEINAGGDKILEAVKNAKPYFSLISTDQFFSYSRPVR